ncbi:MAG: hypothetical protein ACAI35_13185 [Candidatus Methylacidiphilales bacterium]|nr:hypothetical protein [Candidatus Methylacidiphilales bacterium]
MSTTNRQILPQATPPSGYHFRDVQLELSLKPFWDNTPESRDAVCRELFEQWRPLVRYAGTVSVMLWIGDGSEILEYEGDMNTAFEWGRYHGCVNAIGHNAMLGAKDSGRADHDAIGLDSKLRDSEARGVHRRSYLYRPEPAVFTYTWLRDLVATLKATGAEVLGKPVLVGGTFDIGPEFARSRFKYEWHPEICGGGSLFGGKFIRCDALLHADSRRYAGFPDGIREGTTVGTFLGRQSRCFVADCGCDFLWFSNGFGFALEPWALTGAIFDGSAFSAGRAEETASSILQFWHDFRAELPALPIRTRGTNLATGIDIGSDASPLREIYALIAHVEPPVNSPWAALDGDIGLELSGWMSHIARTPGNGFRYRFYTHDPWWLNSPWLDRYQRQPYDIYLPLSVSRVLPDGKVEPPCDISFLTVDDSHGCMPPSVPTEVIAHVLHAREFVPDAPGPVVWVYPFDAYHDIVKGTEAAPGLPFFGDWFVRGLISHGVPVNTVADAKILGGIDAECPGAEEGHTKGVLPGLSGSVLLAPVLPGAATARLLLHAQAGGRVLFYGPLTECEDLRHMLQLFCSEELEGDFAIDEMNIRHHSLLSAGAWSEVRGGEAMNGDVASGKDHGMIAATLKSDSTLQGGKQRIAGAWRRLPSGGVIAWVRGSLSTSEYHPENPGPVKGPRLEDLDARSFITSGDIARRILCYLGLNISFDGSKGRAPVLTIHRHRNAYVFSGYQPDVSVALQISLPMGAPVFPAQQNMVESSLLHYTGPAWWHHVCRAFVRQESRSAVVCRVLPPIQHGYNSRLLVSGLKNAEVRFFPEPGTETSLEILLQPLFPYFQGNFQVPNWVHSPEGPHVLVCGVEGELLFSW